MALEAVVFSQDPLTSYTYCCNKEYNLYTSSDNNFGMTYDFGNYSSMLSLEDNQKPFPTNNDGIFDVINSNNTNPNPEILIDNNVNHQWDQHIQQQQYNNVLYDYSSPEGYLSGEAPPPVVTPTTVVGPADGGARRKRRRRSCKNKEEVEQQRMTHIAVERNRRKQMNDYLASIRSLMPPSYVQRGDQASIVAGAINYVKELEQLLQSMEAQKRNKVHQCDQHQEEEKTKPSTPPPNGDDIEDNNVVASSSENTPTSIFGDFFSFPQYSTRSSSSQPSVGSNSVSSNSGLGEIEVTMVESHANVKILAKKQPKQLVKLIAAFQGLRLNVLHLNVTTLDSFALYSLSLKVEEGCQLNSVDDIAAAANHILAQIQEEAAALV